MPTASPSSSPTCNRCEGGTEYFCPVGDDGQYKFDAVASFEQQFVVGDCGDDAAPFTYGEITCTTCDGQPCADEDFDYRFEGDLLIVDEVPPFALVEYSFTYDAGCGPKTVECSYYEYNGGETMFGYVQDDEERYEVNDVDSARWGWYQIDPLFDPATNGNVYEHTMYAGAGLNDLNKGIETGYAIITVATCDPNETNPRKQPKSVVDFYFGTDEFCVDHDEMAEHLHVGLDHPRVQNGNIKYGPGQFTPGCCVVDQPCYIAVHADMTEASCAAYGSCAL